MKLTAVALVLSSLLHTVLLQQSPADRFAYKQISTASNEFANSLFEEMGKTGGNVLVCPISLHVALALVYLGAGGNTATQLSSVIRLNKDNTNIQRGYKALLTSIKDNSLKIATKLYPAIGYPLNEKYADDARDFFLSDVEGLNYNDPRTASNTINQYVERQTNGKINNLISPDSIDGQTRLVIINAVHFQAMWKKTFEKAYDGYFKVSPQEKVMTRMMTQTDTFEYKEDPDLQAKILKMDYTEGDYSMIFILPNREDTLPEVEAKLAHTSLPTLLSGLRQAKVEVTIPKFTLEMTINLKDILTRMGIADLFTSRADLSGISSDENLFVSEVIQKTFINVHENGTEAAAATGFLETLSAIPDTNTFSARRPFHFYLINGLRQKMVLFEGRFKRPKKSQSQESSDYLSSKIEGEDEKEPLRFPGKVSGKKPSSSVFPGNANGNQKPVADNRYPASYRPLTTYTPDQRQPSVDYASDRFGNEPPSYNIQLQTPRPLTYSEYLAQVSQRQRQGAFF